MEWLQRLYIFILNPFCTLAKKIDSRIKHRIIYVTCFILYGTCYIWYGIIGLGGEMTLLSRMLESIFLIIILIFCGLEKPLQVVKWNRVFVYTWFVFGVMILVMGFFNEQNTGYWMTGPVLAIGLPCFYMVYGQKEKYELIFDAFCKAAMIITIVYFVACMAGEFVSYYTWDLSGRYNGITKDANKIGELCLAAFCCVMYYILRGKSKRWLVLSYISTGIIIGQVYWTQSRTTILAMALVTLFCLLIKAKDIIKERKIDDLKVKIVAIVLIAAVSLLASLMIVGVHNYVNTNELHKTIFKQDMLLEQTQSQEIKDRQQVKDNRDVREIAPIERKDMNNYSSGRIHIWQTYAKGFNFIGNSADAENAVSTAIYQRSAHNTLIEVTYRSGYFTGAIYLLLEIIIIIRIFTIAFRRNASNSNGDYFAAIVSIGYIVFTNLMPSFNPFTAIIFLIFAIAGPVLFGDCIRKKV